MSGIDTISLTNNIASQLFGFKQSKVLIIERNERVRKELNNLLQNWQCNTQCFNFPEEALLFLEQQTWKPKLIISDFNIDDIKFGIDPIELIQGFHTYDIPMIIFINATELIRNQLVSDSRFTFLIKPINAAQLRFVMKKKIFPHIHKVVSA